MCETYCRDGQMAVLISPRYGAGWSTWSGRELAYDKRVVEAFFDWKGGRISELDFRQRVDSLYDDVYYGSAAENLMVKWVPFGVAFEINEYDGSESIEFIEDVIIVAGPHV